MSLPKRSVIVAALSITLLLMVSPAHAQQASGPGASQAAVVTPESALNYELQVNVLSASNTGEGGRLPSELGVLVRQMQPSLPYSNYRLIKTLLHRVQNGGRLAVSGVTSGLWQESGSYPLPPTFYDLNFGRINMNAGEAGRGALQISEFRFGLRVPIVIRTASKESGTAVVPIVDYQPIDINNNRVNLREGEPVVVGTLDIGRPDEMLIIVLSARRAPVR
ncbi:MAG TPA: hypothetical protein VF723_09885 [Pyrinomonadaceae bacterium]|jgi:hypothetical protein